MIIGEYNTVRPGIKLKEYGRNVQKLVDYIRTIPDKEKRTELALYPDRVNQAAYPYP